MSDFKTRLLDERKELNEKIDKLEAFRRSDKFTVIDPMQQGLLSIQVHAMLTYSEVLDRRIGQLDAVANSGYYTQGLNPSNES